MVNRKVAIYRYHCILKELKTINRFIYLKHIQSWFSGNLCQQKLFFLISKKSPHLSAHPYVKTVPRTVTDKSYFPQCLQQGSW